MSGEPNQVLWRGVQPVAGIRGIWPAIDSVRLNEAGYLTVQGTLIVYTVPAGKILFTSGALFTSRNTVAQVCSMNLEVRNAADVNQYYPHYHYYYTTGQQTTQMNYFPALEAAAGFDVCITNSHGNTASRGMIFGWLEDA